VPSGPPDTSEGTESRDGDRRLARADSRSPAGIAVGARATVPGSPGPRWPSALSASRARSARWRRRTNEANDGSRRDW